MSKKSSQIIIEKMCELFNLKFTGKIFTQQVGIASSLLKTYSEQDIIDVLKYLAIHPPRNGLTSIAYIQYVYNEVMPKVAVERLKHTNPLPDSWTNITNQEDSNNISKYNNIKKIKLKGMGNF